MPAIKGPDKTVRVPRPVHGELESRRRDGETFGEVVERLMREADGAEPPVSIVD